MTIRTAAVVDYGLGNVDSVLRGVQEVGGRAVLARRREDFLQASAVIVPGVGAFRDGMAHLRERGLVETLDEFVRERRLPCLGICLGLQLMCERGLEGGESTGLGWFKASCPRLEPTDPQERVPHIGWNEVNHRGSPLFRGITPGRDFYFVHSYHVVPEDPGLALAHTPYAGGFVSALGQGHLYGVQFHPEKSQKVGLALLKNFLELAC